MVARKTIRGISSVAIVLGCFCIVADRVAQAQDHPKRQELTEKEQDALSGNNRLGTSECRQYFDKDRFEMTARIIRAMPGKRQAAALSTLGERWNDGELASRFLSYLKVHHPNLEPPFKEQYDKKIAMFEQRARARDTPPGELLTLVRDPDSGFYARQEALQQILRRWGNPDMQLDIETWVAEGMPLPGLQLGEKQRYQMQIAGKLLRVPRGREALVEMCASGCPASYRLYSVFRDESTLRKIAGRAPEDLKRVIIQSLLSRRKR